MNSEIIAHAWYEYRNHLQTFLCKLKSYSFLSPAPVTVGIRSQKKSVTTPQSGIERFCKLAVTEVTQVTAPSPKVVFTNFLEREC